MRIERAERFATNNARSASTLPLPPLACAARSSRQHGACRLDRVELVGLAVAATLLPIRAINLDHGDARRREMTGQAGTVGAGPFDPDPLDRTERTQPRRQRVIASRRRRKRPHTQQAADRIDRGGDMHIEMRVDTPTIGRATSTMAICHPFSRSTGQGVARTSREGDRDEPAAAAASSITLRNGACLVTEAGNVATTTTNMVDPPRLALSILTGQSEGV